MHVVLVVRHLESVPWFVDAVKSILGAKTETSQVKVDVHVTLSDGPGHAHSGTKSNEFSSENGVTPIPDLEKTSTKTKTFDSSALKLFLLLKETGSDHSNRRGDYEHKSRNKCWCCYLLFSPPHLHFCSQVRHIFPIDLLGIFLSPAPSIQFSSQILVTFVFLSSPLAQSPIHPPCPRPSRSGNPLAKL
jgi:hypothetical protein